MSLNSLPLEIGAWSSNQSKPIESRSHLANQEEAMRQKLCQEFLQQGKPIPRPPHWGGYRLRPTRIEFWKVSPLSVSTLSTPCLR
jgi:pyridoxamine 5'-phosphate oxidase